MNETPWYVARIKPGYSRSAVLVENGQASEVSKVEAELRKWGFGCYSPRMRLEKRHHRTKKIEVKSYPLFTGYVFIDRLSVGRKSVKDIEGIAELLGDRNSQREAPYPVAPSLVRRIMAQQANLDFDNTQEARIRRKEEGRTRKETARMRFKPGRQIEVNGNHHFGGFHGQVESVTGRGTVRVLLQIFGGLVPVELAMEAVDVAA